MSEPIQPILYSRRDAAAALSISTSTLDVMIGNGLIRARRLGRHVLIPRTELERVARQDFPKLWPAKVDGKTTRVA